MLKTLRDIVIYLLAVVFWEWLVGKFIDLRFDLSWGIWDFIKAGIALFVADFFAAMSLLGSRDRESFTAVIFLLSGIFIVNFGINWSDSGDIFASALVQYDLLIMLAAAITAYRF
jgi:hypothetical protein